MAGLSYWRGLGVAKDPVRAEQALRRACRKPESQDHEACQTARSILDQIEAANAASPAPAN